MPAYGALPPAPGGLSDASIDAIRHYLTRVRDGVLEVNGTAGNADSPGDRTQSFTFPTAVYSTESSLETLTVRFTNLRDNDATVSVSIAGTLPGSNWFTITGNTCGGGVGAATDAGVFFGHERLTVSSCDVTVKFTPKGTQVGATSNYAMTVSASWAVDQGGSPAVHTIALIGTSLGPRKPIYAPSGFNLLSTFSAATDASQVKCPTITNSGSAQLQLAFSANQSGASDYRGYYDIVSIGACPAVPAYAACTAPSATISGTMNLPSGAGLASSCTLPIRFNPAKYGFAGGTGARAAQLVVTHNDPTAGTVATSVLLGNATTGPQPAIGLSPNPSVDGAGEVLPPAFAAQIINTTSAAWDLPVFNSGTADGLDLTAVTSSNSAEFPLTEDCVSAPALAIVVGTNPHCTVTLHFKPTLTIKSCTMLTIQAAFSSNGIQVLKVCGTGIPVPAPKTSLSRTSIDFGQRSIGAIYKPETVVITNLASATADLTLTSVAIVGAGFTIVADPTTTACPGATLPAGTSCTVPIQFTPTAAPGTAYSATLAISSNDPLSPNPSVSLTAYATASALPVLEWVGAPAKLVFTDPIIAGQQSTQTVTARLNDVGPGAADIASLRLVGPDASSFALGPCPATLFEGEFCDVVVYFLPGSGGVKSAQIEVRSATGVVPTLLPVEGQGIGGVSAYLQASADTLTFGEVRVGTTSDPQQLRLTAFGGVVRVTAMSVAAPYSIQSTSCPAVPFTLLLGGDCTISVSFSPSATQGAPAALSISTDATPQAVQVALDGNGGQAPDVSGGGCSIASGDSLTDPTLWLLGLLAACALACRRRTTRDRRD
ncbi:MAG: choice-of-anchor D domain-containing protein [Caldimonas sp.]